MHWHWYRTVMWKGHSRYQRCRCGERRVVVMTPRGGSRRRISSG